MLSQISEVPVNQSGESYWIRRTACFADCVDNRSSEVSAIPSSIEGFWRRVPGTPVRREVSAISDFPGTRFSAIANLPLIGILGQMHRKIRFTSQHPEPSSPERQAWVRRSAPLAHRFVTQAAGVRKRCRRCERRHVPDISHPATSER